MLGLSRKHLTRRQLVWEGGTVAVLAAATALLSACGQAQTPTSATAAPKPTAAPAATAATVSSAAPAAATNPAASGPVTLKIILTQINTADQDAVFLPKMFQTFTNQNNGAIKMDPTTLPEDDRLYVKILTMIAGGTPPDLAYVHPIRGLPQYAGQNVVVPIDDYIKADTTLNLPDLLPGPNSYYSYPIGASGAKTYGICYYSGPSILLFNKKVFQQAGEKTPDQYAKDGNFTWDTYVTVASKITSGSGATKQFGSESVRDALDPLYTIVWEYGGQIWDETMDHCLLGEQLASQALDLYASIQYKYKAAPSAAEAVGLPGGFMSGRVGMSHGIKENVGAMVDAAKAGKLDPGIAPWVSGPKGLVTRDGPNSFCIMRSSTHQAEAYKFMAFTTHDDFQFALIALGTTLPIRKSHQDAPNFVQSLQPWEDIAVYKEASDKVKPLPVPTTYSDIAAAFAAEYDLVKLGTETYKDAAAKFVPKIEALLKKAKS